jgi:hypothetical protein
MIKKAPRWERACEGCDGFDCCPGDSGLKNLCPVMVTQIEIAEKERMTLKQLEQWKERLIREVFRLTRKRDSAKKKVITLKKKFNKLRADNWRRFHHEHPKGKILPQTHEELELGHEIGKAETAYNAARMGVEQRRQELIPEVMRRIKAKRSKK